MRNNFNLIFNQRPKKNVEVITNTCSPWDVFPSSFHTPTASVLFFAQWKIIRFGCRGGRPWNWHLQTPYQFYLWGQNYNMQKMLKESGNSYIFERRLRKVQKPNVISLSQLNPESPISNLILSVESSRWVSELRLVIIWIVNLYAVKTGNAASSESRSTLESRLWLGLLLAVLPWACHLAFLSLLPCRWHELIGQDGIHYLF